MSMSMSMDFALPFLLPPLTQIHLEDRELIPRQAMSSFSFFDRLLPHHLFLPPAFSAAMEDLNTIAADCIVISCCCQCLALQILLLLLLKLPWKLVRKTREFAKRKLRQRVKEEKMVEREMTGYRDELRGISNGRCMRNEGDGLGMGLSCCAEEIEKVMEDLHEKGEFGFGSFWGKGNSISGSCRDEEEFCATNVQYQLIRVNPSA